MKKVIYKLKGSKMESRDFIYIEQNEVDNIFIMFNRGYGCYNGIISDFEYLFITYINEEE